MSVAAILLAAGHSRRFEAGNKLAMPLDGIPLGLHAARTLARLPLDHRIVVTGRRSLDWPGFTTVENDDPQAGMGYSLAVGVAMARALGAGAVLIALADMPFVSVRHFEKLLACSKGPASLAGSGDGSRRMPPALFGSDWFAALEGLTGDAGARTLLANAPLIVTGTAELSDIDDLAGFRDAEQRFNPGLAAPANKG